MRVWPTVHKRRVCPALSLVEKEGEDGEAKVPGDGDLSTVEAYCKLGGGHGADTRSQTAGALAKEELGSAVDGKTEEELLQVDSGAVARNGLQQVRDVSLKGLDVSDLRPDKVGSKHVSTVLPLRAIGGKDAVA